MSIIDSLGPSADYDTIIVGYNGISAKNYYTTINVKNLTAL